MKNKMLDPKAVLGKVAGMKTNYFPSVEAIAVCGCDHPLADTLYPTSLYCCDSCGEVHGTRAVGGAVNWQCRRELVFGADYHAAANQSYVGFQCVRCHGYVNREREDAERALRRAAHASMWNNARRVAYA